MVRLARGVLDDPYLSVTVTGSLRRLRPLGIVRLVKNMASVLMNARDQSRVADCSVATLLRQLAGSAHLIHDLMFTVNL